MNKVTDKAVQISEKRFRHSVKIYDDPSPAPQLALLRFMQQFVDCPALLQCGPGIVQKFAFFHNGDCWVMAGEAEHDA